MALANPIFKTDVPTPEESFWASLYPENFKLMWTHYNLTYLKYWGLYHEKEMIGTVGIYAMTPDELIADWVGWLCVKKEFRRERYGTNLMNFIMDEMRLRNKKTVKLYVDSSADSAIKFYRSMGFYKTGKGKDPGGYDILYFEQPLKECL